MFSAECHLTKILFKCVVFFCMYRCLSLYIVILKRKSLRAIQRCIHKDINTRAHAHHTHTDFDCHSCAASFTKRMVSDTVDGFYVINVLNALLVMNMMSWTNLVDIEEHSEYNKCSKCEVCNACDGCNDRSECDGYNGWMDRRINE
eukprot:GEMP01016652.1.p1 GENE.GEMP01016652.1~~GEMP01016652.1.p1  ORF type:complete len:146 (-),score=6.11 GEMP01016652.1:2131-2568(-)